MKQNIKSLASPGSKWQLDHDVVLFQDSNSYGHTKKFPINKNMPSYTKPECMVADDEVYDVLPKGTKLTVNSKMKNGFSFGVWLNTQGFIAELENHPLYKKVFIAAGAVETMTLLSEPTQSLKYYLRDKNTQHFVELFSPEEGFQLVDKRTKAKVFKREDDIRLSLLISAGYYTDMPDASSMPYWFTGAPLVKGFNLPDNFEIVHYDSVSKKEVLVEDVKEIQQKIDKTWRLRDLTISFGSSVREAYKKMEDKEKLGSHPALVMFFNNIQDYWNDELSSTDVAEVKTLSKSFGKDEVLFFKTKMNACIAFKSDNAATLFLAMYSGNLKTKLINLESLLEVVPTNTQLVKPTENINNLVIDETSSLDFN